MTDIRIIGIAVGRGTAQTYRYRFRIDTEISVHDSCIDIMYGILKP